MAGDDSDNKFGEIVDQLLDLYEGKVDDPPFSSDLEQALRQMVKGGLLDIATGLPISKITKAVETLVKAQQKKLKLPTDGLLVGDILSFFKSRCPRKKQPRETSNAKKPGLQPPKAPKPKTADQEHAARTFDYCVAGELPKLNDSAKTALDVFDEAFIEWQKVLNIEVTRVKNPARANLTVRVAGIDGLGHVLAEATFNQEGKLGLLQGNLDLRIDSGDSFSEADLRATLIHEIGHLLGLDHENDPTSIMAPILSRVTTITGRESSDAAVKKAIKRWGANPFPDDSDVDPI